MRVGLGVSAIAHIGVLTWGLLTFPDAMSHQSTLVEALPVDLIPISELTKLNEGSTAGEPRETPAPERRPDPQPIPKPVEAKPEPVPEPKPPAEVAALPPEPAPKPQPAPPPQAEPAPQPAPPEAESSDVPPPVPRRRPRRLETAKAEVQPSKPTPNQTLQNKKKRDFDKDDIAALLNKQDDKSRPKAKPGTEQTAALGSPTATRTERMTQSELDLLRAQIQRCWNPPLGAVEAESLKVRLQFQLSRDGRVATRPHVVNRGSSPFFRAAADSARRAILRCQPYQLPAEKFETWRDVVVTFDPREMIGG